MWCLAVHFQPVLWCVFSEWLWHCGWGMATDLNFGGKIRQFYRVLEEIDDTVANDVLSWELHSYSFPECQHGFQLFSPSAVSDVNVMDSSHFSDVSDWMSEISPLQSSQCWGDGEVGLPSALQWLWLDEADFILYLWCSSKHCDKFWALCLSVSWILTWTSIFSSRDCRLTWLMAALLREALLTGCKLQKQVYC